MKNAILFNLILNDKKVIIININESKVKSNINCEITICSVNDHRSKKELFKGH